VSDASVQTVQYRLPECDASVIIILQMLCDVCSYGLGIFKVKNYYRRAGNCHDCKIKGGQIKQWEALNVGHDRQSDAISGWIACLL
jgi:hypothetical protein